MINKFNFINIIIIITYSPRFSNCYPFILQNLIEPSQILWTTWLEVHLVSSNTSLVLVPACLVLAPVAPLRWCLLRVPLHQPPHPHLEAMHHLLLPCSCINTTADPLPSLAVRWLVPSSRDLAVRQSWQTVLRLQRQLPTNMWYTFTSTLVRCSASDLTIKFNISKVGVCDFCSFIFQILKWFRLMTHN